MSKNKWKSKEHKRKDLEFFLTETELSTFAIANLVGVEEKEVVNLISERD